MIQLETLPKMIVFDRKIFWLTVAAAPCGCWVVYYHCPETDAVPARFMSHNKKLMDSVLDLKATVDLVKLFG